MVDGRMLQIMSASGFGICFCNCGVVTGKVHKLLEDFLQVKPNKWDIHVPNMNVKGCFGLTSVDFSPCSSGWTEGSLV